MNRLAFNNNIDAVDSVSIVTLPRAMISLTFDPLVLVQTFRLDSKTSPPSLLIAYLFQLGDKIAK